MMERVRHLFYGALAMLSALLIVACSSSENPTRTSLNIDTSVLVLDLGQPAALVRQGAGLAPRLQADAHRARGEGHGEGILRRAGEDCDVGRRYRSVHQHTGLHSTASSHGATGCSLCD